MTHGKYPAFVFFRGSILFRASGMVLWFEASFGNGKRLENSVCINLQRNNKICDTVYLGIETVMQSEPLPALPVKR